MPGLFASIFPVFNCSALAMWCMLNEYWIKEINVMGRKDSDLCTHIHTHTHLHRESLATCRHFARNDCVIGPKSFYVNAWQMQSEQHKQALPRWAEMLSARGEHRTVCLPAPKAEVSNPKPGKETKGRGWGQMRFPREEVVPRVPHLAGISSL